MNGAGFTGHSKFVYRNTPHQIVPVTLNILRFHDCGLICDICTVEPSNTQRSLDKDCSFHPPNSRATVDTD